LQGRPSTPEAGKTCAHEVLKKHLVLNPEFFAAKTRLH